MVRYVLKRLGLAVVTLFLILSLTFILMKLLPFQSPSGPLSSQVPFYNDQYALGYVFRFTEAHPEYGTPLFQYTLGNVNYYYYEKPIMLQYGSWLTGIFTRWEWGRSTSIRENVSAMTLIAEGLPYTIQVNVVAVILSVPLGILLGIWAALRKNKMADHVISTLVMIFISVPSFVFVSYLILIFGYNLGWLPTSWPGPAYPLSYRAAGFVIPVLALSFGSVCGYCRFTRAELCEVLSSDYLLLARTKGLTKTQSVIRHALRNAMVPILPSILAEIIGILGGSIILENLYNIPGIGKLFMTALNSRDYNVLMVDMAVFTSISLVAGVILDLSYGFLDPRIRIGEKK